MNRFLCALFAATAISIARAEDAAPAATPAVEASPAAPAPAAAPAAAPAPAPAASPKIVVLLPEQVDTEWFWNYYSDTAQHIVQTKVEKALINAGFDVVDLASIKKLESAGSIQAVLENGTARKLAADAGATYAIVGAATAVKGSQGEAYGINVIRSSAEITARILRVSDGKVLAVEDASEQKGGQAARAAGQEALKGAGDKIARKLATALKKITEPAP